MNTFPSESAFPEPTRWPDASTAANLRQRFKYPGLAMGLAILAAPLDGILPPAIVGLVIARAALPTWKRTLQKLRKEGRLDAELLDSLWILFHTVTGELIAPALAILLTESGNTLRDATAVAGHRRRPKLNRTRQYWIERNGRRRLILSDHLEIGDRVFIGPGDRVPADGTAVGGEGVLDQTALTGVARPVKAAIGQPLYASTVLVSGNLVLEVETLGVETRAERLLASAQDKTTEDTRIGNYAAELGNRAVGPALAAGVLVFAATGNAGRALAPLQLDFAQGIGVSAPVPVLASLQHTAANRVLIRGGHTLEQLARVDAVVFDKTGTLTRRQSEIAGVELIDRSVTEDQLLSLAAAASFYVLQPFATALVQYVEARGIAIEPRDPAQQGETGLVAEIDGAEIVVGNIHYAREHGIEIDPEFYRSRDGVILNRSIRYVARDKKVLGALFYSNPVRPESATAIRSLQALGIRCYLMTGDSSKAANAVAYSLGIRPGDTYAEASSDHKVELVRKLQTQHRAVAYVGDGLNDAPAMSYADAAISFHRASDIARETADVVLLDDDLRGLSYAVSTSREAMALIRQNISVVASGNVAAVLGGVFFNLSPVTSVVLNNGAMVVAGLNGLRPLLAGPRVDAAIHERTVRDDQGLLGVPWRKRQRSAVGELLQGGGSLQQA